MSLPDDFEVRVDDALKELERLPDGCVQTCVTSPPYWGLRDYGVEGQLGLEPTPEAYVEKLVAIFGEVRRVLRDDGTLWLNLGDSYVGANSTDIGGNENFGSSAGVTEASHGSKGDWTGLPPKNLIGIPWRVAFALQDDGWWLRSDIIWHKPNPMPESVTDRPTSSHEHIFLLAKSKRYYYDHEAIKEEGSPNAHGGGRRHSGRYSFESGRDDSGEVGGHARTARERGGRNKRDVWTVTTKPFPDAHFAVYPSDLIVPCVKAGTSQRGQCVECGAPWERMVKRGGVEVPASQRHAYKDDGEPVAGDNRPLRANGEPDPKIGSFRGDPMERETIGWSPTCDCAADTEPQLVLDPFCGAGTTGVVCTELGRRFLGIELNPEYADMARRRIMDTNPSLFREAS